MALAFTYIAEDGSDAVEDLSIGQDGSSRGNEDVAGKEHDRCGCEIVGCEWSVSGFASVREWLRVC